MIRMSKGMLRRARAETDRLLDQLDPDQTQDLRVLVDASRAANGAVPFREHDFQALIERLRRDGGGTGAPTNGVSHDALADLLVEAAG